MLRVLELVGLNDKDEITVVSGGMGENAREIVVDNTIPLLNDLNRERYSVRKFLLSSQNDKNQQLPIPDVIVNSITDPIGSSRTLSAAALLVKNAKRPVVNAPEYVENTDKERLYLLMQEVEGVTMPETLSVRPRTLADVKELLQSKIIKTPFLFSERGRETEHESVLIAEDNELNRLECFAFDGREFIVQEFVDYKNDDGLYRKYRYFMINGQLFPGYLIISNVWKIKDDQQTDDLFAEKSFTLREEERRFLTTGGIKHKALFSSIAKKIKLDFFSLDCTFTKSGELLLFDVSTAKHYFSKDKHYAYYEHKLIKKMVEAIEWMLIEKVQGKDIHV